MTVRIASPILELPFIAHNSDMIGECLTKRDRLWSVNLGNIDFQSYNNSSQDGLDEYERFKLIIDSIGLRVSTPLLYQTCCSMSNMAKASMYSKKLNWV